jgi:O-antigen ligase
MVIGMFVMGLSAGPWFSLPIGLGIVVVGVPSILIPGIRWLTLGFMTLLFASLTLGFMVEKARLISMPTQFHTEDANLEEAQDVWTVSINIMREFPLLGAGFGSFASIYPYFKVRDVSSTTAMSTVLQWGAEAGVVGLGVLALVVLWSVLRLPASMKGVGFADRALARGLIGAAVSFGLFAFIHWTIELSAVAISASAVGGTWNRWLAGGTDLFVEHG